MSSATKNASVEITCPAFEQLEETLALAFGHMAPEELRHRLNSILAQCDSGTPDGVFQAVADGRRIGALFARYRTDGTVLCWVPTMSEGFSAEPFYAPLERFGRQKGAAAVMALADLGQQVDEPSLLQAGFEYLSDMLYLVLPIQADEQPEANQATDRDDLDFFPMSRAGDDAFERMVDRVRLTYRNTRDFPRLLRIMEVREVLDGYRTEAPFDPDLWFFVRKDDRDIGVLLLSDQPEDQLELTYMGLVEEVRGTGFGRKIVAHAVEIARLRNRIYLLTSVDERNTPALRSYLSQGMQAWDRKKVYARFFD